MLFPPLLAAPIGLVPLPLIERVAQSLFDRLLKVHPDLFDRLGDFAEMRYRFSPTDLPLHFAVLPAARRLTVRRKDATPPSDAAIAGPLGLLLGLLEGRLDGDALFFSRDLSVTGDMEAMLALRNALDDSTIDLAEDLGAMAGPLSPVATRLARDIRSRALGKEQATWN